MPWFERDGFSIRYQADGDHGAPIVLLHEMGMCLDAWDETANLLSTDNRVLRMDMRGAGLSQRLLEQPAIEDFVEDIRALLDHCKVEEPALLAGGAAGGALALAFAATHPDRTLAVIAASPAVGVPQEAREASLGFADVMEKGGMASLLAAGAMDSAYPDEIRNPAERYERFKAIQRSTDGIGCANIFRMVINLDLEASLASISRPVLLLGGKHDGTRPPAVVQQLASTIPGARFEAIETGHFLSIQAPELVSQIIQAELRWAD